MVIAGAVLWFQTRTTAQHGRAPIAATTSPAPAGVLPTGPAPLGTVSGATLDLTRSGLVTFAQLGERQVTYPQEVNQLRRCGAQTGSTEVLYGSSWGVSASVFGCRDTAAAQQFIAMMDTVEADALGFGRVADPAAQVHAFSRGTNPGNPNYPDQAHLRYRSGTLVVGIAIQARTPAGLRDAQRLVLASALAAVTATG